MATETMRRLVDRATRAACLLAVGFAVVPLLSILAYLVVKGFGGLSISLFTRLPAPVGEPGGGFANAIVGTLLLVGMSALLSVPAGVLAGVYLAEFGAGRFAKSVRFAADVLSGVPSIAVGVFAYTVVVLAMHRFSAMAGAFALSIIMLPTVTRSTEELVRLVPNALREGGLALGLPKYRVILKIVLPSAASGIATGVMLAVARAAGETAPLLFTSLGNRFWSVAPDRPIASLPVQIYTYAVSPYDDWHRQAWAAALVLVAMVLTLNVAARWVVGRQTQGR